MQSDLDDRPLAPADPEQFARLRQVLAQADYTDQGVIQALGIEDVRSASGRDIALLLHCTSRARAVDTLIRLFLMGVATDLEAARRAVAPMSLEDWVEAGLVQVQGTSVAAKVQLLPFQGLVLAFDHPRRIETGQAEDYVMGVGSSSLTLANLTVRRPSQLTLDLGTGCGFQAFLAAPHSARVLAVDRNRRAVQIARFNAQLNNLSNVDCREGDLFEPVSGCQFDLVVSNPPFVISPEARYIYRDSGMRGDEVSQRIVREVPAFLREGGYCQILCNWAHVAGQPWQQRLAAWCSGAGCDVWVMRSDTLDSAAYAAKWIRHTERDDPEQFNRRFQQWIDYYRQQQIEAVSGGLITMRRRSSTANWFRADDAPPKMLGPAGECVARGFQLRDFLQTAHDDGSLMSGRLRVSPDARLQQHFKPAAEGWQLSGCELELERGLAYSGDVDPYVAELIARCNGQRRLGDLVAELAGALQKDLAQIAPACLDVVRRLIERGFLLPADDDSERSQA